MNAEEFLDELSRAVGVDVDDDYWGWSYLDESLTKRGVTNITVEDKREHTEGNWRTDLYVVFKVLNDYPHAPQYFKKTGYYQSHEGSYWDGPLVEVQPQQKSVTVWTTEWEEADSDYDSFDSYDSYY